MGKINLVLCFTAWYGCCYWGLLEINQSHKDHGIMPTRYQLELLLPGNWALSVWKSSWSCFESKGYCGYIFEKRLLFALSNLHWNQVREQYCNFKTSALFVCKLGLINSKGIRITHKCLELRQYISCSPGQREDRWALPDQESDIDSSNIYFQVNTLWAFTVIIAAIVLVL